ncbi:MAG: phosphonate ABC transporter ATP-binding protein [Pseudomonadota bacterium]|nr:phosphonate ABC transporter ATP-binding protein [Pseudomonadota bacterium]
MTLPTPAPLLTLRNVSVAYPDGHQALHSTSMQVKQGEFLVLLGASGAGKSTLLRSINGLVRPTGGEVLASDLPAAALSGRNLREHRRRCGMVFQQHHLIGRLSVLANVLIGRVASRGLLGSLLPWRREDKLAALAVIERVGLLDKALARADTLSGGQQQRVGIARALVQRPRLLLADEPVASLDPATADTVLALLHEICKNDGLTAIVSLHQVALARRYADRIIGLRQGRIVFDGEPAAFNAPAEAQLYASPSTSPEPIAVDSVRSTPSLTTQPKELQPC